MTQGKPSRRRHVLYSYVAPTVLLAAGAGLLATAASLAIEPAEPVGAHIETAATDELAPVTGTGPADPTHTDPSVPAAPAQPSTNGGEGALTPDVPREDLIPAPKSEAVEVESEADEVEEIAPPEAVEIPRIDVQDELIDLDLDADRRLEVPQDPDVPGWYVRSARPGEQGPAVIAGHVDSQEGPGIFWRLPELEPGDEVIVHRHDGSDAVFIVDRLERWPKSDFPTDDVYGQTEGAELRLITCGGVFDEDERSYRDNIIVFASAAED